MRASIARRSKTAEAKIAQAEVQAVADVRAAAAEATVSTAETIRPQSSKTRLPTASSSRGVDDLKTKLN